MEALDRLGWLRKFRTCPCPDHGTRIRHSQVRYTGWCPVCQRVWRLVRNEHNWKVRWSYEVNKPVVKEGQQ